MIYTWDNGRSCEFQHPRELHRYHPTFPPVPLSIFPIELGIVQRMFEANRFEAVLPFCGENYVFMSNEDVPPTKLEPFKRWLVDQARPQIDNPGLSKAPGQNWSL